METNESNRALSLNNTSSGSVSTNDDADTTLFDLIQQSESNSNSDMNNSNHEPVVQATNVLNITTRPDSEQVHNYYHNLNRNSYTEYDFRLMRGGIDYQLQIGELTEEEHKLILEGINAKEKGTFSYNPGPTSSVSSPTQTTSTDTGINSLGNATISAAQNIISSQIIESSNNPLITQTEAQKDFIRESYENLATSLKTLSYTGLATYIEDVVLKDINNSKVGELSYFGNTNSSTIDLPYLTLADWYDRLADSFEKDGDHASATSTRSKANNLKTLSYIGLATYKGGAILSYGNVDFGNTNGSTIDLHYLTLANWYDRLADYFEKDGDYPSAASARSKAANYQTTVEPPQTNNKANPIVIDTQPESARLEQFYINLNGFSTKTTNALEGRIIQSLTTDLDNGQITQKERSLMLEALRAKQEGKFTYTAPISQEVASKQSEVITYGYDDVEATRRAGITHTPGGTTYRKPSADISKEVTNFRNVIDSYSQSGISFATAAALRESMDYELRKGHISEYERNLMNLSLAIKMHYDSFTAKNLIDNFIYEDSKTQSYSWNVRTYYEMLENLPGKGLWDPSYEYLRKELDSYYQESRLTQEEYSLMSKALEDRNNKVFHYKPNKRGIISTPFAITQKPESSVVENFYRKLSGFGISTYGGYSNSISLRDAMDLHGDLDNLKSKVSTEEYDLMLQALNDKKEGKFLYLPPRTVDSADALVIRTKPKSDKVEKFYKSTNSSAQKLDWLDKQLNLNRITKEEYSLMKIAHLYKQAGKFLYDPIEQEGLHITTKPESKAVESFYIQMDRLYKNGIDNDIKKSYLEALDKKLKDNSLTKTEHDLMVNALMANDERHSKFSYIPPLPDDTLIITAKPKSKIVHNYLRYFSDPKSLNKGDVERIQNKLDHHLKREDYQSITAEEHDLLTQALRAKQENKFFYSPPPPSPEEQKIITDLKDSIKKLGEAFYTRSPVSVSRDYPYDIQDLMPMLKLQMSNLQKAIENTARVSTDAFGRPMPFEITGKFDFSTFYSQVGEAPSFTEVEYRDMLGNLSRGLIYNKISKQEYDSMVNALNDKYISKFIIGNNSTTEAPNTSDITPENTNAAIQNNAAKPTTKANELYITTKPTSDALHYFYKNINELTSVDYQFVEEQTNKLHKSLSASVITRQEYNLMLEALIAKKEGKFVYNPVEPKPINNTASSTKPDIMSQASSVNYSTLQGEELLNELNSLAVKFTDLITAGGLTVEEAYKPIEATGILDAKFGPAIYGWRQLFNAETYSKSLDKSINKEEFINKLKVINAERLEYYEKINAHNPNFRNPAAKTTNTSSNNQTTSQSNATIPASSNNELLQSIVNDVQSTTTPTSSKPINEVNHLQETTNPKITSIDDIPTHDSNKGISLLEIDESTLLSLMKENKVKLNSLDGTVKQESQENIDNLWGNAWNKRFGDNFEIYKKFKIKEVHDKLAKSDIPISEVHDSILSWLLLTVNNLVKVTEDGMLHKIDGYTRIIIVPMNGGELSYVDSSIPDNELSKIMKDNRNYYHKLHPETKAPEVKPYKLEELFSPLTKKEEEILNRKVEELKEDGWRVSKGNFTFGGSPPVYLASYYATKQGQSMYLGQRGRIDHKLNESNPQKVEDTLERYKELGYEIKKLEEGHITEIDHSKVNVEYIMQNNSFPADDYRHSKYVSASGDAFSTSSRTSYEIGSQNKIATEADSNQHITKWILPKWPNYQGAIEDLSFDHKEPVKDTDKYIYHEYKVDTVIKNILETLNPDRSAQYLIETYSKENVEINHRAKVEIKIDKDSPIADKKDPNSMLIHIYNYIDELVQNNERISEPLKLAYRFAQQQYHNSTGKNYNPNNPLSEEPLPQYALSSIEQNPEWKGKINARKKDDTKINQHISDKLHDTQEMQGNIHIELGKKYNINGIDYFFGADELGPYTEDENGYRLYKNTQYSMVGNYFDPRYGIPADQLRRPTQTQQNTQASAIEQQENMFDDIKDFIRSLGYQGNVDNLPNSWAYLTRLRDNLIAAQK